jgi:hypothetical protein
VETVERPSTLGHQVFTPLRKEAQHFGAGLRIDGCQALVTPSGQRGGEGVQSIVLAGVASEAREHTHPCRKLGRHVHHRLVGCYQPLGQVPTKATSVLYRPTTLREPLRPAFEGSQASTVLQEASTLEELAGALIHHRGGD